MKNKLLPVSIVAKRLGVTGQCVRDAIHCKELKAINKGLGSKLPRWYVTEEDYQEFVNRRNEIGE